MPRHGVEIPQDVLAEVQRLYLEKRKTTHGAIKAVLARGVDLALAELREQPPPPAKESASDRAQHPGMFSAQEAPYVEALLYFLRESNEGVREMVKSILKPGLGKLKKERKSA
jgi:hypothetical protein